MNVLQVKYWIIFKPPRAKVTICYEDPADSPQMWQCGLLSLVEKYDSFFPMLLDDSDDGSRLSLLELLMISFCCWSFSSFSRNLRSFSMFLFYLVHVLICLIGIVSIFYLQAVGRSWVVHHLSTSLLQYDACWLAEWAHEECWWMRWWYVSTFQDSSTLDLILIEFVTFW